MKYKSTYLLPLILFTNLHYIHAMREDARAVTAITTLLITAIIFDQIIENQVSTHVIKTLDNRTINKQNHPKHVSNYSRNQPKKPYYKSTSR